MCFASETTGKVDALGLERVRCLLYCCVQPLQIGALKRRQRNHVFWEEKAELSPEGQSVHKILPCIPGSSCFMDAVGLLVSLPQSDLELPSSRS